MVGGFSKLISALAAGATSSNIFTDTVLEMFDEDCLLEIGVTAAGASSKATFWLLTQERSLVNELPLPAALVAAGGAWPKYPDDFMAPFPFVAGERPIMRVRNDSAAAVDYQITIRCQEAGEG